MEPKAHSGLHLHAALGHVLLDFLVADPDLAVALDVGKFHVDLVEDHLFATFLVDDRVDGAGEHEVRANFHASVLERFVCNVALLVGKFVAEVFAFVGVRDKFSPAGIDESTFDVLDERFDADVLVALVADLANHDSRDGALLRRKLVVPRAAEAVINHFVGNKAGIGVVPATGKVRDSVGVKTGDFFASARTGGKKGDAYAKGKNPNF